MQMPVETIISGGQTGVDRAALDTALQLDIPHAGWCPAGRLAEDGIIPEQYKLTETPTGNYLQRTEWNVRDSDGTLIICPTKLEGGTEATRRFATQYNRPCLVINPLQPPPIQSFRQWLQSNNIQRLNIAGPRASKQPEIYQLSRKCLLSLLAGG